MMYNGYTVMVNVGDFGSDWMYIQEGNRLGYGSPLIFLSYDAAKVEAAQWNEATIIKVK